jgi:hypothetical protein
MHDEAPSPIGPHDLGGRAAGPVDTHGHAATFWEKKVDALVYLMFEKKLFSDTAVLRLGIESLKPEDYETMGYYERWAASAARALVARGLLTQAEIDARAAAIAARRGKP